MQTQQRITCFFFESTNVQDFLVIKIVAKLKPTFIYELLSNSFDSDLDRQVSFNTKLNELVTDLLPPFTGERIDSFGDYKAVRHVLYFEPDVQLLSLDDCENFEKSLPLLERLRTLFGLSKRTEIPTILGDVVLLPGLGYGNQKRSCVAVRLHPFDIEQSEQNSSGSFQIPLIPISFLNHVATCTIKDFCSHMLASLSLSTNQYWGLGKSWGDFVNYHSQYMKTRFEVEQMVLKMEELDTNIDLSLETIHLYTEHYVEFLDKITFQKPIIEILKKSLSEIIKVEKRSTHEQLRRDLARIKTRMSMLDNFLHDSALADSTSTNLRLAKSVEKLTWVVIFIASLTFIATLIPDAIKETALARMLKYTNIEWQLGLVGKANSEPTIK